MSQYAFSGTVDDFAGLAEVGRPPRPWRHHRARRFRHGFRPHFRPYPLVIGPSGWIPICTPEGYRYVPATPQNLEIRRMQEIYGFPCVAAFAGVRHPGTPGELCQEEFVGLAGLDGKFRKKLKKGFKKLGRVVKKGAKTVLELSTGVAITAGPAICMAIEDEQKRAACMAAMATIQAAAASGEDLPDTWDIEIPEDTDTIGGVKKETLVVAGGLTIAGLITVALLV